MNSVLVLMLLICLQAGAAAAELVIDSLPVAAACKTGQAHGPLLLPRSPVAGEADLYQAAADISDWGGHFSRYLLAAGAGGSTTLAWDAGIILTGTSSTPPAPAPALRQIYTAIVQPDGALAMVPFAWASLSTAQQALLNLEDGAGEQRLAYLRGDRTLEGAPFRRRGSILGDAIHSTPVYTAPAGKRAAVFLGANDGMLHAFDAITGVELFAYVPDALIENLHHLTNPAYLHRAYVDGPASIGGEKKNVLVSAMGGGAKGVFALDVSDPARFAGGGGALWEFTDRHDAMMGNVITLPQVTRVRVRKDVDRDFAIVTSGLNASDGALFLLALDKPRSEGWQRNVNYYRIKTRPDALSAPALINSSDGVLRYAYAGDLDGRLWRFDFRDGAPSSADQLFTARDASGNPQPITEQPLLAHASGGGYMVLFGTGQLIEAADRVSRTQQSYYAIIDNLLDSISGRRQLTQRFLDGADLPLAPGSKGWFIDFTQPSERSTHAGVLADGAVLFNTVLPGADMCSTTRSRSYVLNVLTGLPDDGLVTARLPSGEAIVGAMLPEYAPVPLLLPQSVVFSTRDALGRIRQEKEYALVQVFGSGEVARTGSMKASRRVGRLSWREIVNWRELHEAAK